MSRWYLDLVDRMMKSPDFLQKDENGNEGLMFKPFITVARDPGSGGRPIAEMLAKKLGFEFYDRQFMVDIAKSAKARTEILEEVDEKSRTQVEDLVHNILNPEYLSERRYIKHLCKVVLHRAKEGKVVFLGRGTNFITPNAYGLHVRITAPYRVCVSRAVQYEHVTNKKAREIIQKVTKERAEFVKQYFGKNAFNCKYYDLNLNTTYMTLEDAVELIMHAFGLKFPQEKV